MAVLHSDKGLPLVAYNYIDTVPPSASLSAYRNERSGGAFPTSFEPQRGSGS